MLQCKVKPQDEKPYIFISYAHADKKKVHPIIEELDHRGYRVWYDRGIVPGRKWPEVIGKHVKGCKMMLAFITDNYAASDYCLKELSLAQKFRKTCATWELCPTQMTDGLLYLLTDIHLGKLYEPGDDDLFWDGLNRSAEAAACRREENRSEAPDEEESMDPAGIPGGPARNETGQVRGRAKSPALLMVICLCAMLAGILLLKEIQPMRITRNVEVYPEANILRLDDEVITENVIKRINKLEELKALHFYGCRLEPGALALLDSEKLSMLGIYDTSGVDDLSCIRKMEELQSLFLVNVGLQDDMLPRLDIMSLEDVNVSGNPEFADLAKFGNCHSIEYLRLNDTGVTDLGEVSFMDLRVIEFKNTPIADIGILSEQWHLEAVYGDHSGVTDISPLSQISSLVTLSFSGCELVYPEVPFSFYRLTNLYLSGCGWTDLSCFSNCSVLSLVDISESKIEDISVLENNISRLKSIDVSNSSVSHEDLLFLADGHLLREVLLDGIKVSDLNFLENADHLCYLSASMCGIEDISALEDCVGLEKVHLSFNQITDISPLRNIQQEGITLDLGFNPITDVSVLPQVSYDTLCLLTDTLDLGTLPDIGGGNIVLSYNDGLLFCRVLSQSFSAFYFMNCPLESQIPLTEYFSVPPRGIINDADMLISAMDEIELDYGNAVDYLKEKGVMKGYGYSYLFWEQQD